MSRVIQWIADVLADRPAEAAPHFHQGPDHTPAVCFDDPCRSPRLDVRTG